MSVCAYAHAGPETRVFSLPLSLAHFSSHIGIGFVAASFARKCCWHIHGAPWHISPSHAVHSHYLVVCEKLLLLELAWSAKLYIH